MPEDAPGPDVAGYAAYAQGVVDNVRHTAEDAIEVALEVVGETIPKILNGLLAALVAGAVALIFLGLLAIFATSIFLQLLAIIAGLALVATGVFLFAFAWRLHAATASIRTMADVARKWRMRRDARRAGMRDQV
ncbi:MAG: hypothetical protein LC624_07240 [Halobacteriales archaeon]|nr:hypothetical protein [Halobacteriales archaeon]